MITNHIGKSYYGKIIIEIYHGKYYGKIITKIYYGTMMKHRSGNKTLLVGRLDTKQNRRGHMTLSLIHI